MLSMLSENRWNDVEGALCSLDLSDSQDKRHCMMLTRRLMPTVRTWPAWNRWSGLWLWTSFYNMIPRCSAIIPSWFEWLVFFFGWIIIWIYPPMFVFCFLDGLGRLGGFHHSTILIGNSSRFGTVMPSGWQLCNAGRSLALRTDPLPRLNGCYGVTGAHPMLASLGHFFRGNGTGCHAMELVYFSMGYMVWSD